MKLDNMLPFRRTGWTGIALMSIILGTNAAQEYCSTQNTGSDYSAVFDIYQSNGACHDTCVGSYAFAVVQYQNCWCSNYIPAQQADVGTDCNQSCPGFPDDKCGDANSGYYGYIALNKAPSGTAGAVAATSSSSPSSTPQSSTEDPETSYVSQTVVQTVTQNPSPTVVVSYVTPTPSPTSTPHTTSTSTTSSTSTTPTPTIEVVASPITSVIMTTISGAVVTQTVTTTPYVAPSSNPDNVQFHRQSGLGAGAIAGIVVGVIAGLAVMALAAFLLWRRRRNNGDSENQPQMSGSKRDMQRNVSVLSKAGLLGRARPSTGERDYDEPYGMTGSNSQRHSMLFSGADGISPVSPLDSSHSGGSRRLSKPMVYDQRLNPSALFANQEANGSRISMQDTQDYSRPLGVMNPDPRSSFESRLSHQ